MSIQNFNQQTVDEVDEKLNLITAVESRGNLVAEVAQLWVIKDEWA